ncbi:DedA family protein [Halobacillus sp. BBL2006]|uniref:DedA family protein n=1 Tax=Halobacillus sp. BBL2006 TaxID=1543706 RepID=UPI0005437F2D|nr:DedA family protein [Halobacillus sp. BBL2006]KHE71474.1 alkaline phosphatase [Halobacillus sp. BBL2006]
MENWLIDLLNTYGYLGILFLIAFENIFPPIPSEVILTFSGFMTTTSDLSIWGVIFYATAGSVIGAMVLYGIGLQLDVEKLEKIVDKWGHLLRLTKKDIHKADQWFDRYGPWTVLFCRFVPLVRSLISIPAGMSNMNFILFLALTGLGTLIWNVVLVNIGASLGASWEEIIVYMNVYSKVIYLFLGFFFVFFTIWFIKKKRTA